MTKKHLLSKSKKRLLKKIWRKPISSTPLIRLRGFTDALNGIFYTLYSQRNFQIHLLSAILTICLGLYCKISILEWYLVGFSISLVLITETINTSIEITVDLITKKRSARAMLAKDIAAGAVLLSAIHAIIIGYIIFFDKIKMIFQGG